VRSKEEKEVLDHFAGVVTVFLLSTENYSQQTTKLHCKDKANGLFGVF